MPNTFAVEEAKNPPARKIIAGRALLLFLVLMAVLTLASRALQEMTVPQVKAVSPQRGSLEMRVNGEGILEAALTVPVVIAEAARTQEVLVQVGAPVSQGTPLFTLDYGDIVKELSKTYEEALESYAAAKRDFDWENADVSEYTLKVMLSRAEDLEAAEEALEAAEENLEELRESGDDSDIRTAERAVKTAESKVNTARRQLNGYTRVREYLTKQAALAAATAALEKASQEYSAVLSLLDQAPGSLPMPEEPQMKLPLFAYGETYLRTVTAPLAGKVEEIKVSAGATVSTGEAVMLISDPVAGLSLTLQVEAADAAEMSVGDISDLAVDSVVYQSPITAIAPSSDGDGTFEVTFTLSGEVGSAGMRGWMYYKKRSQQYDTLIPLSALRSDSNGDFVYSLRQEDTSLGARMTLERIDVVVLEQDSTRAAVQGGISQRDQLAGRSDRAIEEGDRVRLEED